MQNKFFVLLRALIICNSYILTNALVGHNIRNATRREYPAAVCLILVDPDHTIEDNIFCTGVFITQSHILSCQHCFDDIGDSNFKIIAEHPNVLEGIEYFVWWWTTYNIWARGNTISLTFRDNDVAMLKIQGEASRHMVPSVISTISTQSLLFGLRVQVTGYGRTNINLRSQILQTTNVYVLTNQQCEEEIFHSVREYLPIHERYLCTFSDPHALLAEGDSGGPVYYQGLLVALNRATIPNTLPMDHSSRVNIHLGLEWYRNFINELLHF